MNTWFTEFWNEHGSKLIFGTLALTLACGMYFIFDMKEEAQFVYISLTGFCLKYIRGGNGVKEVPPDQP